MGNDMSREFWANALATGQKILSIDPFMEHVQRAVMRCHFRLGNRPAAVKQYATCAKLLRQELNVEPMEETRQILETIVSDGAPPWARALFLDKVDGVAQGGFPYFWYYFDPTELDRILDLFEALPEGVEIIGEHPAPFQEVLHWSDRTESQRQRVRDLLEASGHPVQTPEDVPDESEGDPSD